jgi:mRNA-degrading endonuclease RelE of RelBE toxin-antitoxin system
MNEIEKLFQKIPVSERKLLEQILKKIFSGDFSGLHIKKLKGFTSLFRVRVHQYRIIFLKEGNQIFLKTIKKRNESTYRDL